MRIYRQPQRKRSCRTCLGQIGCGVFTFLAVMTLLALLYFLLPFRTNILLLGNDARPGEGDLGRTDTMIMMTVVPLEPYVGALSIPRDLWVTIPGVGENRINTAHFYGEANQAGGGPQGAIDAVEANFGVDVDYYVRLRFDGFREVVDAMGGIDVELPTDMSGYAAGTHHMSGDEALALVRDRSGSDDFYRMGRGQIFIKAVFSQMLKPESWVQLPGVAGALAEAVDTDIPLLLWPRLGLAGLRAGPGGIDARSITREMVVPFTTDGGAAVLAPNWEAINPVLLEMFDQ